MDIQFSCQGSNAPTHPGWVPGGVGVYLHGRAEEEAGFDIPDSNVDLNVFENGVYPVRVNGNPGYTLFFWRATNGTRMPRGLVVKDTDTQGVAFARHQHAQAPAFL